MQRQDFVIFLCVLALFSVICEPIYSFNALVGFKSVKKSYKLIKRSKGNR